MPKDFDFVIDSGANDKYDSKTQTLVRQYTAGSKSFIIPLSEENRIRIYQRYKEIDFLNIPSEFERADGIVTVIFPSFNYSIEVCERNQIQNCHTVSIMSDKLMDNLIEKQKATNFKEFYDFIWNILRETSEYKQIPKSDVFYM
jgi:hypothetical protein